VAFGTVVRGQNPSAAVKVESAGQRVCQVLEMIVPKEAPFTATLRELYCRPGQLGYEVTVTLRQDAAPGTYHTRILLKTDDPDVPLLPVFVNGEIQGP
jgi:hypothetical protein